MKKLINIAPIILIALMLFSFTVDNQKRRPMFGSVSSNCVWESSGDGCITEYCDYDSYFFWIRIEHLSHIPGQTICE